MDSIVSLLTTTEGRIGRQQWWIGIVVLIVVSIVASIILSIISFGNPTIFAWLAVVLNLALIWPSYCLGIKRRHDRDNNGMDVKILIGGSVNAAAANFTKGLSRLGMRDGVHVNAVHPGMTATERTEQLLVQRAAAQGEPVEEVRAAALARTGARRMGTPEDIAALTLFLCSERARHVQGTAIAVDGGATPGVY